MGLGDIMIIHITKTRCASQQYLAEIYLHSVQNDLFSDEIRKSKGVKCDIICSFEFTTSSIQPEIQ